MLANFGIERTLAQILRVPPKGSSPPSRYTAPRGGTTMKLEKIPGRPMSKPTMPRLSIRARLMLLALLAVVPLTFDRVRLLEAGRTERIEMTSKDMLALAKRGADAQVEMIDATRSVLAVVARSYATLARSGQDCAAFLAGFALDVPWIRALSVAGPPDHQQRAEPPHVQRETRQESGAGLPPAEIGRA